MKTRNLVIIIFIGILVMTVISGCRRSKVGVDESTTASPTETPTITPTPDEDVDIGNISDDVKGAEDLIEDVEYPDI